MWFVILASTTAWLLSLLDSKGKLNGGLKLCFIIVTVIEAIHYNYGTDYMGYLEEYRHSFDATTDITNLINFDYKGREPGWSLLYSLFGFIFAGKDMGFFSLVALLSVIQNIIYYKLITVYVPRKYWCVGAFIYLFSAYELYLINMSMLRQGLAIALFVASFNLIRQKKLIAACLLIIVSFSFHKSAIFMLPFVLWGFISQTNNKLMASSLLVIFVLLFFSSKILGDTLSILQNFVVVDNYLEVYETDSMGFGLGFAIRLIPFVLYLSVIYKYGKSIDKAHYLLLSLTSVGFLIEPFTSYAILIARVTYFFTGLSVAALPVALSHLKSSSTRFIVLAIYVVFTLYMYFGFYNNPNYHNPYMVYHTIFETI